MSDPWVAGPVIVLSVAAIAVIWAYLSDRAFTRKYGPDRK